MGTPTTRTPVRIARGTYSNLNTNKADILEGEICYAHDQNKLYIKEGSNLETHESADASKLPLAGGTMTGAIAMGTNKITGAGDPTGAQDVATKTYVDTADALKMPLGGGTFSGAVTFAAGQAFDGRDVSADGTKLDGIAASANNYAISADLLDEDDMSTNSATKVPSQQSVKAYADTKAALTADNTWTGSQRGSVSTLTYGSTVTIDMDTTNNHKLTLTGNSAMRFNNPTNCDADAVGQSGSIFLIQDGTGSGTAAWGTDGGTSSFHWKGGTAPTLSTAANAVDRVDYIVYAANKIHCVATIGISANT